MPRSFFEILTEKKSNLRYKTQGDFELMTSNLTRQFFNFLGKIQSTKASSVFDSEGLGAIETEIKKDLEELRKFDFDRDKYRWNDPSVQEKVEGFEKKLEKSAGNFTSITDRINNERIELLGDNGSLRIANTFFETAESLTTKGGQVLYAIKSLDSKETKSKKRRQNTDIMEIAVFDSKLADITAKKGEDVVRKTGESDADFKKRQDSEGEKIKEREKSVAKFKAGIFQYAAGCLGDSAAEIEKKWDSENTTEEAIAKRNEILIKIIPYLEGITDKKYTTAEKNPFEDKQFMADLEILASYTPNYQNFEYKDGGAAIVIEEADRVKIAAYMEDMKKKILKQISEIKTKNSGSTPKQKQMTEEMDLAESDLKKVDPKNACDYESRTLLQAAQADMKDKISKYEQYLTNDDKKSMEDIAKLLAEIDSYCSSEKYREKQEKPAEK